MSRALAALAVTLFVASGCNCNGGVDPNDDGGNNAQDGGGTTDGGENQTDGGGVPDDGGTCEPVGATCATGVECCSGLCEATDGGSFVCSAGQACNPLGTACSGAQDCCSLNCVGGQCSSGLCTTTGSGCANNAECCTGICQGNVCAEPNGATCNVAGDSCTTPGISNECCSRLCQDFDPSAGTDLRCGASQTCRSSGEPCSTGSDCCSYTCNNGFCDAQPHHADGGQVGAINCLVVGSSCQGSASCCSNLCGQDPTGFVTCQYLGGCRPEAELCRKETDCCNFYAANKGTDPVCEIFDPVQGIGRCRVITGGNAPAGELCSGGGNQNTCAPNGDYCTETIFGVSRCAGECDGGICGATNCRPAGDSCLTSDQCCSRVCSPAGDGGFACSAGCLSNGLACTTSSDCCSGVCSPDGVCTTLLPPPDAGTDGGVCKPIGASCTAGSECCSLTCDPGTLTCHSGIG